MTNKLLSPRATFIVVSIRPNGIVQCSISGRLVEVARPDGGTDEIEDQLTRR